MCISDQAVNLFLPSFPRLLPALSYRRCLISEFSLSVAFLCCICFAIKNPILKQVFTFSLVCVMITPFMAVHWPMSLSLSAKRLHKPHICFYIPGCKNFTPCVGRHFPVTCLMVRISVTNLQATMLGLAYQFEYIMPRRSGIVW